MADDKKAEPTVPKKAKEEKVKASDDSKKVVKKAAAKKPTKKVNADTPKDTKTKGKPREMPKSPGMYAHIGAAWKKPADSYVKELQWHRMIEWRKQGTFVRLEGHIVQILFPADLHPPRDGELGVVVTHTLVCGHRHPSLMRLTRRR